MLYVSDLWSDGETTPTKHLSTKAVCVVYHITYVWERFLNKQWAMTPIFEPLVWDCAWLSTNLSLSSHTSWYSFAWFIFCLPLIETRAYGHPELEVVGSGVDVNLPVCTGRI